MRAGPAWAAILEVLGVYVAGQLVMFGLATVLGIELRNPLAGLTAQISSTDLVAVFARTRSLIPSMVAHALANIPATLPFQVATLVAMAVVIWLARRRIADAFRQGVDWIRAAAPRWLVPGVAVGGAAFAVVNQQAGDLMLPAAIVMLVVAIGLEFREKRRG